MEGSVAQNCKHEDNQRRMLGKTHTSIAGTFAQSVHVGGGQASPGVECWRKRMTVGGVECQGGGRGIWHSIFGSVVSENGPYMKMTLEINAKV